MKIGLIRSIMIFLVVFNLNFAFTQNALKEVNEDEKMQWFSDAKLGIFIHWGIYAVNGVSESWSFFNGEITHEDYLKQLDGFTAHDYEPDKWASLIANSGAKYAVITSKHHDGFALWDTQYGKLNAINHSAARKDLLSPFMEALQKKGIKKGLYYSLPDWSHENYSEFTREVKRYKIEDEPERWLQFQNYYLNQLKELSESYNPDLWWFDGDWEHNEVEWDIATIKAKLSLKNPDVIFNSRLCGHGDYETPEIGLPVLRPKAKYWELCMTMNDSWGFQHLDTHYKSSQQVIDIFVDCISKGGNLLLDIGPKADGIIPAEQVQILQDLGKWTKKHERAIFATKGGIPYEYFQGASTLSKDSTSLFLFLRDIPKDGKIMLKGISNKIEHISIVGQDYSPDHELFCKVSWNTYPGIYYIEIPQNLIDDYYTVIEVQLEDKIDLYSK